MTRQKNWITSKIREDVRFASTRDLPKCRMCGALCDCKETLLIHQRFCAGKPKKTTITPQNPVKIKPRVSNKLFHQSPEVRERHRQAALKQWSRKRLIDQNQHSK